MTQSNGSQLLAQGRIVWITGKSLFEGKQKTDFNSKQPIFAADGSPVVEYGFGLAIPKTDANGQPTAAFTEVWNTLHKEAMTLYPSGQIPPGFAMKYKDGDGIDHNGKPFADREGYKNHIVLTCTTQIPIQYFRFEGGNNILVNDGIKCGDYVNVQITVKAHPAKGQGKAGLYVNPHAVQLIQSGPEIVNAPSGDQIFANASMQYQGEMQAAPQPSMPQMQQQAPAAPQMSQQPMQQPVQQQAPQMPQQQAQPHYGVLPEQMQQAPAAPQMPQQPVQQQAPQMPTMPMPNQQ